MAATVQAGIVLRESKANPCTPQPKVASAFHPVPPQPGTKHNVAPGKQQPTSSLTAQLTRLAQRPACPPPPPTANPHHPRRHLALKTQHSSPFPTPPTPNPQPDRTTSPQLSCTFPTRSPPLPAPNPSSAAAPKPVRQDTLPTFHLPRIDSLPFDMDDDDLHTPPQTPPDQDPKLTPADILAIESIRRAAQPTTPSERHLAVDVADAYLQQSPWSPCAPSLAPPLPGAPHPQPPNMLPTIARHLDLLSYTVHIKTAIGGGVGRACFSHQPHTFIMCGAVGTGGGTPPSSSPRPGSAPSTLSSFLSHDASPSTPRAGRLIVDPLLRDQFALARPTTRYVAVLAAVPAVFVGSEERLTNLVQLLSAEVALSFRARGLHLPPWREADNVISKWLPSRFTVTRARSLPAELNCIQGGGDVDDDGDGSGGGGAPILFPGPPCGAGSTTSVLRPAVSIRYFKLPGGATC